jgi:class 3 adenylate cyclase
MEPPETQYVTIGDADVAYQVFGEGPRDVLVGNSLGGHVDVLWQVPDEAEFLTQLSRFSRVLHMDRRGCGASDSLALNAVPTWEEFAEDLTAVLDAANSTVTDIIAVNEVGPMAILFAAMHPERVGSLILINTAARYIEADDYTIGVAPAALDAIIESIAASWGSEEMAATTNPARAHDREFIKGVARQFRASATPRTAASQLRYFLASMDVRTFLPLVQAPTLVLQVRDSPFIVLSHGQYLAEHIPGATFIEMPGGDMNPPYGPEAVSDIAEFLTGERVEVDPERILATVLLSDIVGSTERAASLGDKRWRSLLDAHDGIVRSQIRRFRGREINTTGDGFVVSFDGPARAVHCAQAIVSATRANGIDVRVGLHTGECEVRGDDLGGLAVHIAARIAALAKTQEIFVSGTLKDLVIGSGIEFEDRGERELRGVPGTWKLFAVKG